MDRVLKRVGLSRRTISAETKTPSAENEESGSKSRRRRRSKSRRRVSQPKSQDGQTITKKTRGLFNIDWDSVRDCRACKSRVLTRRFCNKKCDNELYRSNSFKFERFVRGNEEVSTLEKKISLCDDYSLPLDHLNKRRPNSIAVPSASEWNVSSPNEERVQILETYSTPRDSKQQLSQEDADIEQKCFTSPDREYSQPYTTDESSGPTSDEEFFGHQITLTKASAPPPPPPIELNSPDSIAEAILPLVNVQSPVRIDAKRHPSPYYYSDLYKPRATESPTKPAAFSQSETINSTKSEYHAKKPADPLENRQLVNTEKVRRSHKSSASGHRKRHRKSSAHVNRSATSAGSAKTKFKSNHYALPQYDDDEILLGYGEDLEMSRQRHVYETAFDCRISKSDDDLDQIDKVSNHSVLSQYDINKTHTNTLESQSGRKSGGHCSARSVVAEDYRPSSIAGISEKLEKMHLPQEEGPSSALCPVAGLPLRGFTPSPPSTAPLPTKFHGKESIMNSIRSAPNLPSHSKARLKNLHLPLKSLRGCSPAIGNNGNSAFEMVKQNAKYAGKNSDACSEKETRVLEIKDRPRKDLLLFKRSKDGKGTIIEFKGKRRRPKYSSTESMTTSSSGGSMESIKSSTSEGNRSTTSSESRNSSSLSSHDSDSGSGNFLMAQSGFHAQTKLHILSPISDKSSQEPVSEMSDNNRNNNSQKCSPEEAALVALDIGKSRRRFPQNKNLLNLSFRSGDPEIQGSDSGISIQSREGVKSRFTLTAGLSAPSQTDFSDLPFDMPKLRRRRLATEEAACTSGSATSIDFGELPFDMPKLRRRLRVQQSSKELSVSQASSSQSVIEPDSQAFRPKLSLNLSDLRSKQKPGGLGLSLTGFGLNAAKSPTNAQDLIDIELSLEKQGWYHGAITRVEAENVLRLLREGSFLVRNSESTKQDYSLSLKSARGFMHMRIQRDDSGGKRSYILGQFSKPFNSIPEMIRHFSLNGLPIRGAEHMCLVQPVIAQML